MRPEPPAGSGAGGAAGSVVDTPPASDDGAGAPHLEPAARADRPDHGRGAVAVRVTATLAALVYLPVFHRLATDRHATALGINDFHVHLGLLEGFSPLDLPVPHPGFYLAVWLVQPFLGIERGAAVVLGLAVGASAVALVRLARRPSAAGRTPGIVAACAFTWFILLAESPNPMLQSIGLIPQSDMMPTTHSWGSPTETMMVPFLLFLLATLLDVLDGEDDRALPSRTKVVLAVLAVATALAKPTFLIAMLFGLPLYLLLVGRWRSRMARDLCTWMLAPIVVVMAWQTWFAASGRIPVAKVGLEIAPFEMVRDIGLTGAGPAFWIAPGIVLVAALVGRRRFFRDPGVALSLCTFAVSIGPLLLLKETGASQSHGNFSKSAWIAWFVVHLFTTRFLLVEVLRAWSAARGQDGGPARRLPAWTFGVAAFWLVCLVVGVVAHLLAAGVISFE